MIPLLRRWMGVNTLRPRQNGRHFPDDIFKCIFLNENVLISLKISLKFVHKGPINNIPALVQEMAWRRPGDKPLSEAMVGSLLTHIYVTRPQWVKSSLITDSSIVCKQFVPVYNWENTQSSATLAFMVTREILTKGQWCAKGSVSWRHHEKPSMLEQMVAIWRQIQATLLGKISLQCYADVQDILV